MYAGRKRKRPAKRLQSKSQSETKSNPSKRHRDRLNGELEKLANLLPFNQDVISKLDKLSILRLSVSYLRNKRYFEAVLNLGENKAKANVPAENVKAEKKKNVLLNCDEGDLSLEALGGFVLVVAIDGSIFYSSPTITDYLGFHQSDVMNQSVYEIIHTEDRSDFQQQLIHRPGKDDCNGNLKLLNGGVSQNSELGNLSEDRNFVARFRCLLDNSSGFLSLHFTGKLKPLSNRIKKTESDTEEVSQLALFSVACPMQTPSPLLEVHMRNLIFRTKHNLDFTPLSVDQKGIDVLGYTEVELTSRTGYHYIHHDDLIYTRNQHETLMKKGETGFIYLRILTKKGQWLWVQSKARLIYKNNRPDYIVCTHRPMSDEEGKQHLSQRNNPFKFTLSSKETIAYECNKTTLSSYPGIMRMSLPNEMPPPKRSRSKKRPKLGDLRNMGPLNLPNIKHNKSSNNLYSGLHSKSDIISEQQYIKNGVGSAQQYSHTNGLQKKGKSHHNKSWMEVVIGAEKLGGLFENNGGGEKSELVMGSSGNYGNGYTYNVGHENGEQSSAELYSRGGGKYQEGYLTAAVDDGCVFPGDMVLNGHGYNNSSYANSHNGLGLVQGQQEFEEFGTGHSATTTEGLAPAQQFVFETAVSVEQHTLSLDGQLLYHQSPAISAISQAYMGTATTLASANNHCDMATTSSAAYDSDQTSSSYKACSQQHSPVAGISPVSSLDHHFPSPSTACHQQTPPPLQLAYPTPTPTPTPGKSLGSEGGIKQAGAQSSCCLEDPSGFQDGAGGKAMSSDLHCYCSLDYGQEKPGTTMQISQRLQVCSSQSQSAIDTASPFHAEDISRERKQSWQGPPGIYPPVDSAYPTAPTSGFARFEAETSDALLGQMGDPTLGPTAYNSLPVYGHGDQWNHSINQTHQGYLTSMGDERNVDSISGLSRTKSSSFFQNCPAPSHLDVGLHRCSQQPLMTRLTAACSMIDR